jgi:hypothetical protein
MKASIALLTLLAALAAANPIGELEKRCKNEYQLCRSDKPCCDGLTCKVSFCREWKFSDTLIYPLTLATAR